MAYIFLLLLAEKNPKHYWKELKQIFQRSPEVSVWLLEDQGVVLLFIFQLLWNSEFYDTYSAFWSNPSPTAFPPIFYYVPDTFPSQPHMVFMFLIFKPIEFNYFYLDIRLSTGAWIAIEDLFEENLLFLPLPSIAIVSQLPVELSLWDTYRHHAGD